MKHLYYIILVTSFNYLISFGVTSQCTPPAAPTVPSTLSVSCGGSVTVSPSGSTGNYAYYSDPSGNDLLGTGATYELNGVSSSTTVYVAGLLGSATQTFPFTNCGATGRLGPTQAQANTSYSGTSLDGEVNIVGSGIQEWVVPATGVYVIEAAGAGFDQTTNQRGAVISGEFNLTAGDVLQIVVGQMGTAAINGNGGSFVVSSPYNNLSDVMIAAGGAGGWRTGDYVDMQGQITEGGANGSAGGSSNGGTNGQGGQGNSNVGGGGGFLGNGNPSNGIGGYAFVNGAMAGNAASQGEGGFGGGGTSNNTSGCGGGGGYSGGGRAWSSNGGGGGGSFNGGTNPINLAGENAGHGYVNITFTDPPCISALVPVNIELSGVPSPTVTATTNPIFCGGDTDITATGGTGDYIWFSDPNGNNVLGTASLYNTGSLTTNTTFYVSSTLTGSGPGVSYEFTNCGAEGREGPTQAMIDTEYASTPLDGQVTSNNGIQIWTVPVTGDYLVEAYGAQGSTATGTTGGRGAYAAGEFNLTAGDQIQILVGQNAPNTPGRENRSSSGGGGSFVTMAPHNTNASILVIAGGGGGTGDEQPATADGTSDENGQTGSHGAGGTNGNGGTTGTTAAGAGAGFFTDGDGTAGGEAYVNGGLGGITNATYSINGGGFGGGGSVTSGGNSRYGGGGGYSGGSGSNNQGGATSGLWGGGGGSYNNGTNQVNQTGVNEGHGSVTITELSQVCISTPTAIEIIVDPIPNATSATANPPVVQCGMTSELTAAGATGNYAWFTDLLGTNLVHVGPSFTTGQLNQDTTFYVGAVPSSGFLDTLVFTNSGAVGSTGPSQMDVNTAYASSPLDGQVTVVGDGIQQWVVPNSGVYYIEAAGAGADFFTNQKGALVSGEFNLNAGDVINVLVGQTATAQGAGSGGTFVVDDSNNPLLVAGGAGGANDDNIALAGQSTEEAIDPNAGAIGEGGGSSNNAGSGGGGFFTDGNGGAGVLGLSYLNGGVGGTGGQGDGGFGGGAGNTSTCRSSGGGGYSGGGGSTTCDNNTSWGGGGGSFNSGNNPNNVASANAGNGYVKIASIGSCISSNLLAVNVNVTAPSSPSVNASPSTVNCGDESVLTASGSTGSYAWYADPNGDSLLAQANPYTTDPLSATTTFYVGAYNGNPNICLSDLEPTTVNVDLPASPSASASPALVQCGDFSTLSASGGTGDYNWYADPLGDSLIGTGSTFQTNGLNSNTTFYVAATDIAGAPQTYNFTNAGATGNTGPSQSDVNSAYSGTSLDGAVTVLGSGIQQWVVPTTATYQIEAAGAGADFFSTQRGAILSGEFTLNAGDILNIVVGQAGTAQGAGSGGTFVVDNNDNPLIVAGGAGGANTDNAALSGQDTEDAQDPNGGTNGNGGTHSNTAGSGGGGFFSNGTGNAASLGRSYLNGAEGGTGSQGDGGFGGGAGNSSACRSSGGGGYSGGGGSTACSSTTSWGGGGGSFNSGTNPTATPGANAGQGYVTISSAGVNCESALTPVTVDVDNPPAPSISANPSLVQCGDTSILTASGSTGNYNWYADPLGDSLIGTGTTYEAAGLTTTTTFYAAATTATGPSQVYEFTNCGAEGREGPTQAMINAEYAGTPLDGQVTSNNGIQEWEVPVTGTYTIEACGAEGLGALNTHTTGDGGLGACMEGEFQLNQGDVLQIIVGQQGIPINHNGVGGGGSFVVASPYNTNAAILVIAGGGGGKARSSNQEANMDGSANPEGQGAFTGESSGGLNGDGGGESARGKGGGGFFTDGIGGAAAGRSFINGGIGGLANSGQGGFGGGATSSNSASNASAGAGGGYSGGGGAYQGSSSGPHLAGGGGSFNNGANQNNQSGVHSGHGFVRFSPVNISCESTLVPITVDVDGPPAPTANANPVNVQCGDSSLLTASGSTGSYNWYADPLGTDLLGTGSTYQTDGLSANTTFYAAATTATGPPQVYEFTNCGAEGREGPTQAMINAAYAGTPLDGQVTSNNGIQIWTVPVTGDYLVEAYGAQGSTATATTGGRGAYTAGEFSLTAGDQIQILVGQNAPNTPGRENRSSSGGGGSFVTMAPHNTNASILVIAGGGGGTGDEQPATADGTSDENGQTGSHGTGGHTR